MQIESKCKIEWLSQYVLRLGWSSACATWPASGCPLQNWKTVTASFQWRCASDLSFIQLPIFHEVYRNFIYWWLLPLCEGELKLINRFKCLERITEWWGLGGTSVGHLVQPPCWSRVTYSRLHKTLSKQVLNTSRVGDSANSLGSLFQCSVTLRVKKFFLMFRRNFIFFSLCPLSLVLSLGTTEKSLAPSSWHPPLRYL